MDWLGEAAKNDFLKSAAFVLMLFFFTSGNFPTELSSFSIGGNLGPFSCLFTELDLGALSWLKELLALNRCAREIWGLGGTALNLLMASLTGFGLTVYQCAEFSRELRRLCSRVRDVLRERACVLRMTLRLRGLF